MQKGYKREGRGKAILHCFIGLFFIVCVILAVWIALRLDYSDVLDPETSMRPYVETTATPTPDPASAAAVQTNEPTQPPATATEQPTATPYVTPTQEPTPTPAPSSIPSDLYAKIRTFDGLPSSPTGDNCKLGITRSYRSAADGNRVMYLEGYAYIDDASFDGSQAKSYLVIRQESTGRYVLAELTMRSGASGLTHEGAQCANASAADFDVVLDMSGIADDLYTLGIVIDYTDANGEKQRGYYEFPAGTSFSVLNSQVISDVPTTVAE